MAKQKSHHSPINPPTPKQVETAEASRYVNENSSYLDEERAFAAEIRRAEVEGRKPNLKDFHENTIRTVDPTLLKNNEEPVPDTYNSSSPQPQDAGNWQEQTTLKVQDESDPAVPVKELKEVGEPKNTEDDPVMTVKQDKDDDSVPVKNLVETEVKKEEAKEQAEARVKPTTSPLPVGPEDDRNPAAKVQLTEDNVDSFNKELKKSPAGKVAKKATAKKAPARKKTTTKKTTTKKSTAKKTTPKKK